MIRASFFLLVFSVGSSLSAIALEQPVSTDQVIIEVEKAADLDFGFIKNGLLNLQDRFTEFIRASYINLEEKISDAVNQTYQEDLPKNQMGYDTECIQGVHDEMVEIMEDLNIALEVCGNLSQSGIRAHKNIAKFQSIISDLGVFSQNLMNLINECVEKIPVVSWERLECVFQQVDYVQSQFVPVLNQFKMFNVAMRGHLMLLGLEITLCYQKSLSQLTEINETIRKDVSNCKIQ